MCKISIIVPIYNVAPYLKRCLDSALAQTAPDVEIICVDDGSTDGSSDILREYERADSRIKAIYQENAGLSAARNAGLDAATGEYVAFLDSDDWFEPNACEAALRRAEETGAEITRFFARRVWENADSTIKRVESDESAFGDVAECVATDPVERLRVCFEPGGPNVWSKLWRRDFLERNDLRFRVGLLWEDVDFTGRAATAAEKVATLRQILHNYRQRSTSIIGKNRGTAAHADGLTDSLDGALDAAEAANVDSRTLDWLHAKRLQMLAGDFRASNDWAALEIIGRKLRAGDWRLVFDPNFETNEKDRRFFATLYDQFFSDEPLSKAQKKAAELSNDFIERGKKAIEASRVVSFDVFDTLLIRPFVKPTDLFRYLEELDDAPGFAEARIEAERAAWRRDRRPEITFEEIYREIPSRYAALKNREYELELRTLKANPDVATLYEHARKLGKPIFIVSDMYFTETEIRAFLEKNGYVGFRKLYVSADYRKRKEEGDLFDVVLAENAENLGVEPSDWLHVGDNPRSDGEAAREKGLKTFAVTRLVDEYFERFPSEKALADAEPRRWETSFVLAAAARRLNREKKIWPNGNYWRRLGYRRGGPVVLAFAQFVEKIVQKRGIDALMFVARDGWTLRKAYSILFGDEKTPTRYVYASRRVGSKFLVDGAKSCGDATSETAESAESRRRRVAAAKYFESETPSNARTVAFVDAVTENFSALKLARAALSQKNVRGVYWTAASPIREEFSGLFDELLPFDATAPERSQTKNWNFMEFLTTSPEPPVRDLTDDGKPIYDDSNVCERWRSRLYRDVAEGELAFVRDFVEFFGDGVALDFSGERAVEIVDDYADNLSKFDAKRMELVWHAADSAHQNYEPLFGCKVETDGAAPKKRPTFATMRDLKKDAKKRLFWLCASKPISLRVRSQGVAAALVPRYPKELYRFALKLAPNFEFVFRIGTRKDW